MYPLSLNSMCQVKNSIWLSKSNFKKFKPRSDKNITSITIDIQNFNMIATKIIYSLHFEISFCNFVENIWRTLEGLDKFVWSQFLKWFIETSFKDKKSY